MHTYRISNRPWYCRLTSDHPARRPKTKCNKQLLHTLTRTQTHTHFIKTKQTNYIHTYAPRKRPKALRRMERRHLCGKSSNSACPTNKRRTHQQEYRKTSSFPFLKPVIIFPPPPPLSSPYPLHSFLLTRSNPADDVAMLQARDGRLAKISSSRSSNSPR